MMMNAGSSTIPINLHLPTVLEGHISRSAPARSVLDPLAATAIVVSNDNASFIVVSLDALEFDAGFVATLRERIAQSSGIPTRCVMITATHTHTAPATIKLGSLEPNHLFLESAAEAAVAASTIALSRLEPVDVSVASLQVEGVGVNRRRVVEGNVSMAPNPAGAIDNELTTVGFRRNGDLVAAVVSYSTHPTTLGVGLSVVSADYPGAVRRRVKTQFPNADVVFLTGACGDVRPDVTDGDGDFREGTPSDVQRLGTQLGDAVLGSLHGAKNIPATDTIGYYSATVSIPFAFAPEDVSYSDLYEEHASKLNRLQAEPVARDSSGSFSAHIDSRRMEEAFCDWARDMAARAERNELPKEAEAELQAFCIGRSIAIIALPLEVFAESGLRIKTGSAADSTVIAAYSNGSLGYVPTEDAVDIGGYEVEEAYKLYGLPAPYARDAADRIVDAGIRTIAAAIQRSRT